MAMIYPSEILNNMIHEVEKHFRWKLLFFQQVVFAISLKTPTIRMMKGENAANRFEPTLD